MNYEFVVDFPYKMKNLSHELRLVNRYCKDIICEYNEHPVKFPFKKFIDGKFDSKYYPLVSYSDGLLRIKLFDNKTDEQVNLIILSRNEGKTLWLEALDCVINQNKEIYKEVIEYVRKK